MEGRFQYGFPVSGAGATFSQRLSGYGGATVGGSDYSGRPFQGRQSGDLRGHERRPQGAQAHSACLFTGRPRFPAGDCDQPRLPHHPAEGDENRAKFVDCGHDFRDPGALPRGLFRFGWHYAAFRLHLAIGWRPVHHRAGFEFQLAVV